MSTLKENRTSAISLLVPKLLEAGLAGNRQRLELLALNAIRSFKSDLPEMTRELTTLLSLCSASGGTIRWHTSEPPPTDVDAGFALLRMQAVDNACEPILNSSLQEDVSRFLRERLEAASLVQEGFAPPRTLLLKGPPGTGKTMLARWLASKLNLPLYVLDLATSISSFLGKTGNNLRRSLDFARAVPCVFLLDEFDAIAKRRDDTTEVGELKRIVNVLLKELEEWPLHSVLIAATNHPELLDPAIHRRFDVVFEMPVPNAVERSAILERACGHFATALPENFLSVIGQNMDGKSGSDLVTITQSIIRRHLVDKTGLTQCFVEEIAKHLSSNISKKDSAALMSQFQKSTGMTVRELATIFGKSPSTIQYHLNKGTNHA